MGILGFVRRWNVAACQRDHRDVERMGGKESPLANIACTPLLRAFTKRRSSIRGQGQCSTSSQRETRDRGGWTAKLLKKSSVCSIHVDSKSDAVHGRTSQRSHGGREWFILQWVHDVRNLRADGSRVLVMMACHCFGEGPRVTPAHLP